MRQHFSLLRPAAGTLLALSSVLAVAQPTARRLLTPPSASEQQVALPSSVTDRPASSIRLGHLSPATLLTGLSLILKRTPDQEAALEQLLHDQQDPASKSYHQWLTPQAFGEQFGFAQGDLDAIATWLQANQFIVSEIAPSHNRIVFSGTAARVEASFGLTLDRYSRNGQSFFENSTVVRLPASLAAVVSGVTGLSSYHLRSDRVLRHVTSLAPQYTTSTGTHYLVPWDFRQIYDINSLINAGSDGTGIKIGVIGQSSVDTTQLTYFQQKTSQAAKLPTMVLVPNTGVSNQVQGDDDESSLDLEYSSGNAPGASVQFIYTGCTATASGTELPDTTDCQNDGVNTSLIYAVTHNLAPILTMSYGACEATMATYASSTLEPILMQANAQGQTVVISSGDSGPATCDQGTDARAASHGLTVSYPASSTYVTAVGGTQLSDSGWSATDNSYGGSATGYVSEQAWNDTSAYGTLAASGGGVSKIFPKPVWQVGSVIPQDSYRDVPDVAFSASVIHVPYIACTPEAPCLNGNGFGVTGSLSDGGLYGGTSLAAPGFAAMLAIIEQKNATGPLGNVNSALYAIAQGASAGNVFHETAGGNNVVPCVLGTPDCGESNLSRTIGYGAGGAYSQATGLGSLSATGLATALSAKTPPVSLAASSITPVVDQPVTFTAAVFDSNPAPTGTITFSLGGTAISPAVSLVNGSASYSYSGFTTPSGYQDSQSLVQATYSGDSTYSTSSSTLNVEATRVPVTLSITNSVAGSLQTATTTTFTITASGQYGTPTDYVLLLIDGTYVANAASPLPLVNGVATYSYAGFSSAGVHTVEADYFTQADLDNYIVTPAGFMRPYTAYEGGRTVLDLEVGASSQTLTPLVSVTSAPSGVLAPTDSAQVSFQVAGSGSVAPSSSGYTYVVDGVSTTLLKGGQSTASGLVFSFNFSGNWTPGTHTVQFMYDGDNNYKPSPPVSVTFNVAAPAFTLAASPSTLTVPNGGSGSTTLMVNAGTTYSGSTTFQIALLSYTGAPFSGCAGLSSSSTNSSRGGSASVTLTVYSGTSHCTSSNVIRTLSAAADPPRKTALSFVVASFGILACLAFRRRRIAAGFLAAILSVVLLSAVGCGRGTASNSGSSTGSTTTTTPTGTYLLQVTGISGADGITTAKTTITLVVQ